MDAVSTTELIELAIHRVLRGELAPWIHAVTADPRSERVELHIYHHKPEEPRWCHEFEEVIECGRDQVFPLKSRISLPLLEFKFRRAEEFTVTGPPLLLIYVNPWSGSAE